MPKPTKKTAVKKAPAKKAPSPFDDLSQLLINIYGPPTSGKTMAALSASESWPKNAFSRTKKSKWLILDDVLHIGFDRAALVGLLPHRIDVEHKINFPALLAEYDLNFPKALAVASDTAREIVYDNPKIKVVVHDTVTAMDKFSLAYLQKHQHLYTTERGKVDTLRMYGLHMNVHRLYQTEMAAMPEGVTGIFLFHERVIDEDSRTKKATLQKTNLKKVGDNSVEVYPYVTGGGVNFYTNDASLQLFVAKKVSPKGPVKRYFHPATFDGRAVKNRFEHLFTEPIEADMGKLLDMVRKECE